MGVSQEPLEGALLHIDFCSGIVSLNLWPPELQENKCILF